MLQCELPALGRLFLAQENGEGEVFDRAFDLHAHNGVVSFCQTQVLEKAEHSAGRRSHKQPRLLLLPFAQGFGLDALDGEVPRFSVLIVHCEIEGEAGLQA